MSEALLIVATVFAVRDVIGEVDYAGWPPVVWAGLLALSQLTIVLAACRAWPLAPSADRPFRYLEASVTVMAPFLIWSLFAPAWHPRISGNEALAIGDVRTMVFAQDTYQSRNGGFYDVPECLVVPQRCLPAYPVSAPTFIDPQLGQANVVRQGYRRVFHPGPPADPAAVRKAGASPSSLKSYTYVAVPLRYESAGMRGFCGDATGRICSIPDGRAPLIEQGQCAASCVVLP
jgi:hypothetical protein